MSTFKEYQDKLLMFEGLVSDKTLAKRLAGFVKKTGTYSVNLTDNGFICHYHPHENLNVFSVEFPFTDIKKGKTFLMKCNNAYQDLLHYQQNTFNFKNISTKTVVFDRLLVFKQTPIPTIQYITSLEHGNDCFTLKNILNNLDKYFECVDGMVVSDKLGFNLIFTSQDNLIINVTKAFDRKRVPNQIVMNSFEYQIKQYSKNLNKIQLTYLYYLLNDELSFYFGMYIGSSTSSSVLKCLKNNWVNEIFFKDNDLVPVYKKIKNLKQKFK